MDSTQLVIILVSILASAFFSGMEIAFISANKLKIELDGKQGDFFSRIISGFQKKPSRFIGALLVGNNIALVIYGIYMAQLLDPLIYRYTNMESVVLIVQTLISTVIILITAEFLPKSIFSINPNSSLRYAAFPLLLFYYILLPPILFIIGISEAIIRLFDRKNANNEEIDFGRIDLEHFIREGTEYQNEQDSIEHEIQIFQNALDFSKVKARECMIPRTEIVALDVDEKIETLRNRFVETGLSKILIYRDSIDNIIGYIHSYELFKKPENIKNILLPVQIIPESMPANEILETFIEQRKSIAVVVDEFGGTSGLLTIEDVIEEIFGDIEDEHDKEEQIELKISEYEYLFAARHEIDYLNDEYQLGLPESDQYETLGGLIININQSIPEKNEEIHLDQFVFTIQQVSGNKIETVKLEIDTESE